MAPSRAEWTDLMGVEQRNKGRTETHFSSEIYMNDPSQEFWTWGYDILKVELGRRDYIREKWVGRRLGRTLQ